MTDPHILAIGTALPEQRYEQMALFETYLKPYFAQNRHGESVFRNTGIHTRHLAIRPDFYQQERGTQVRNERYLQIARALGRSAIERCLEAAGRTVTDVDDLIVVSCTGIDTPGLDLLLAGDLGMRSDLKRSTILGMGCYGAFPGLTRAYQSVASRPGRLALVLAIEICSLHFQPQDPSTENLVCSALFGDGAAAALIGEAPSEDASGVFQRPRLLDFETYCNYQTLDRMAFHLTDHGFRMQLSAYVPAILAAEIDPFVDRLLARNDIRREEIAFWAVHPGSSRILDHTQERLALPESALSCSYAVLQDCGNMSSATILFILDRILAEQPPSPGSYGVLLAFGPGLTIEGALLRM
jgi:alkylresorcinol/alkylpyrone synthase